MPSKKNFFKCILILVYLILSKDEQEEISKCTGNSFLPSALDPFSKNFNLAQMCVNMPKITIFLSFLPSVFRMYSKYVDTILFRETISYLPSIPLALLADSALLCLYFVKTELFINYKSHLHSFEGCGSEVFLHKKQICRQILRP
jgi:hypothetical protein